MFSSLERTLQTKLLLLSHASSESCLWHFFAALSLQGFSDMGRAELSAWQTFLDNQAAPVLQPSLRHGSCKHIQSNSEPSVPCQAPNHSMGPYVIWGYHWQDRAHHNLADLTSTAHWDGQGVLYCGTQLEKKSPSQQAARLSQDLRLRKTKSLIVSAVRNSFTAKWIRKSTHSIGLLKETIASLLKTCT